MLRNRLVKGIISRDTDHLALSCTDLIIAIDRQYVQRLNIVRLLNKLNLTQSAFLDFCILCGNDYNTPAVCTTHLLDPESAMQLIQQYGRIELALQHERLPNARHRECRRQYTIRGDCWRSAGTTP